MKTMAIAKIAMHRPLNAPADAQYADINAVLHAANDDLFDANTTAECCCAQHVQAAVPMAEAHQAARLQAPRPSSGSLEALQLPDQPVAESPAAS
jgi:hypothetical protein